MNTDYIRAKVNLLRGSTPTERERLLAAIGVCVGLLPARQLSTALSAQKQDEIQFWLKQNAVRLKLSKQHDSVQLNPEVAKTAVTMPLSLPKPRI